ncbi:hypothetical protein IBX73_04070 [candidate division WOR-3 bacterium]|nr:hypothetical protein [candidate division WOR-3 bacterium]
MKRIFGWLLSLIFVLGIISAISSTLVHAYGHVSAGMDAPIPPPPPDSSG